MASPSSKTAAGRRITFVDEKKGADACRRGQAQGGFELGHSVAAAAARVGGEERGARRGNRQYGDGRQGSSRHQCHSRMCRGVWRRGGGGVGREEEADRKNLLSTIGSFSPKPTLGAWICQRRKPDQRPPPAASPPDPRLGPLKSLTSGFRNACVNRRQTGRGTLEYNATSEVLRACHASAGAHGPTRRCMHPTQNSPCLYIVQKSDLNPRR